MEIKAAGDDNMRRLDRILRKCFPELPLSGIHSLIRKGKILVNNRKASPCDRIVEGDIIRVPDDSFLSPSLVFPDKKSKNSVEKEKKIDIIFENSDLLVINKPAGMTVHGDEESLDSYVQFYLEGKIPSSLSFRPGPLHRLDQPTSGLIAFSKSLEGARFFTAMMRERRIVKKYLSLIDGFLEKAELWENNLFRDKNSRKTFPMAAEDEQSGKNAITQVVPLAGNASYTYICAEIGTGRTHQIRAQAAFYGHPLSGDKKYGGSFLKDGLLLHASTLIFPKETGIPALNAPLPENFHAQIKRIFPFLF